MRYHKLKASSAPGSYIMETPVVTEDDILTMAKQLSRKRLSRGRALTSPLAVKDHLCTLLHDYEHEVFAVLLLDSNLRIIRFHELFRGTVSSATVYPREVVKLALRHNAAALVLTHNHPSGDPTPSLADISLTKTLREALALVDVKVLDHIVVATHGSASLAERGEI